MAAGPRIEPGALSMNTEDILQLPSMPAASPSYPLGPYRFIDREYLIITYQSGPEAIRSGAAGAAGTRWQRYGSV